MVTFAARLKGFVLTRTAGFAADKRGVAAVEFAAILPFLVLLALGSVEFADGFSAKNKLTHVAGTTSDLVAQSKTITNADMTNILNASSEIMKPFSDDALKIIVSGVTVGADSIAKVTWSDGRNIDPLPVNSVYVLPPDLKVPNTFLVVADVSFIYTPTVAYFLTGPLTMTDHFYLKPRLVAKVCRPPQFPSPCT